MQEEAVGHGINIAPLIVLLLASVITIPLFRRLGLGSVLGYLAAGLAIGPFGLSVFTDPQTVMSIAELGVVMFLFVIGLEMEPSRLWGLRRQILGLGLLQVVVCTLLTTAAGMALGYSLPVAFVFGAGFVLTSTAVVMQVLGERGELALPRGQKVVSILLLEDMAIVPLLAVVVALAPGHVEATTSERLFSASIAIGAVMALLLVGRYLLNPMFNILGRTGAREVMTAAALLVVLGAAWLMQQGGLSMAMGAFLAGVMLSESSFRHQLEADIEPFRGLLLGLFFLGVGMALDLNVVTENLGLIVVAVIGFMVVKAAGIYFVARLTGAGRDEAIERTALMAQGGEFAFVLFAAAGGSGLIDAATSAVFTTTVILSMVLTPVINIVMDRLHGEAKEPGDEVERPKDLEGTALLIGFGRFGQMVSQSLLMRGIEVSIIDTDVEMIEVAGRFGFKVWYGDGRRPEILEAAGAGRAQVVMICVNDAETSRLIAEVMREVFPGVPVMARSFDRRSTLALIEAGVVWEIRETLESAFAFGREGLLRLGVPVAEAEAVVAEVRRRDQMRLAEQIAEGVNAGNQFFRPPGPVPEPFSEPAVPAEEIADREAGRA
ncbi:MAG: monovalent cation:proton antiporter-2 (CPA2) family protein [Proteobacteria bacterium]|nr:monovalent cation:proton antiporter-2 (CPA2) family protein [Pseudomonadota bacterium]